MISLYVQIQKPNKQLCVQVRFRGIGALSAVGSVRPDESVSLKLTSLGTFWLAEYRGLLLGPPCSLRLLLPEWPSSSQSVSSEAAIWRRCRSCRSMDALSSSKSSSRSSPSAVSGAVRTRRDNVHFEVLTIIRWRYPFPWYNAWESYANASSAIDPAGGCAARELLAEVGGEVVAVFGEQVVGRSLKLDRGLALSACANHAAWLHTSCIMVSSSSCGRNEKPCSIACLNVPPGGSNFGFVQ
jgi:hypothetical protein